MVSKISGIYAYYDNLKHEIVYVGKDSHIDENRRHKQHYQQSRKDQQQINRILQNDNIGRYTYVILEQDDFTNDILNEKEISWISFFNPKFNFTEGGEGTHGYKPTEEARKKISRALSGRKLSKEHCEKISRANSGKKNGMYGRSGSKNPMYGRTHSEEAREKIKRANLGKNNPNFTDCIRIRKQKCDGCKQGFIWNSEAHTPEKRERFTSVNLQKVIKKVEEFINSEKNVYGYTSYEVID